MGKIVWQNKSRQIFKKIMSERIEKRINIDMEERDKIDMSGEEIVSLASAIAVCLCKKYSRSDLRKLKHLLQGISSNIYIIDSEGMRFK